MPTTSKQVNLGESEMGINHGIAQVSFCFKHHHQLLFRISVLKFMSEAFLNNQKLFYKSLAIIISRKYICVEGRG